MATLINIKNQRIRRLTVSALMIALGAFIDFLCKLIFPFLTLPFGGSISIGSMVPVIAVGYAFGLKTGLFTGFVYSLLQMVLGMSTVSALFLPGSDSYTNILNAILICLIDYVLAYMALGLGGVFKGKVKGTGLSFALGCALSLTVCYLFHVLSGAIFYGAWAEWFFADTVMAELSVSAWILETFTGAGLATIYSLVYNACYMLPELVISVVLAFPVAKAAKAMGLFGE